MPAHLMCQNFHRLYKSVNRINDSQHSLILLSQPVRLETAVRLTHGSDHLKLNV